MVEDEKVGPDERVLDLSSPQLNTSNNKGIIICQSIIVPETIKSYAKFQDELIRTRWCFHWTRRFNLIHFILQGPGTYFIYKYFPIPRNRDCFSRVDTPERICNWSAHDSIIANGNISRIWHRHLHTRDDNDKNGSLCICDNQRIIFGNHITSTHVLCWKEL